MPDSLWHPIYGDISLKSSEITSILGEHSFTQYNLDVDHLVSCKGMIGTVIDIVRMKLSINLTGE